MEKLSHAYIVSSASENARMGKAFYLAEKMLCQSEGERPCGVCRDCRKVKARVHPDLAVVERITDDKGKQKKEILVDQVRAMGRRRLRSAERGRRKGIYHKRRRHHERAGAERCAEDT